MTPTCIHSRHGEEPPLADDGLMLCRHCLGRLNRALSDIVTLWPLLDEMITPGNNGNGGGASGKPGSRPPCDLDVADITDPRSTTSQQLTSWAALVIEERQLSQRTSLDGEQAARLLTVHAEWLAAQPFVDEAMSEIGDAAYRIRRACKDLPEPPLGKCPDIDPHGERDRCGGPLRWIDGSTAVACGRCGSQWIEADLPHILRVVQPDRRFPVPRAWVAATYGVAPGTLRQWIRRGHVKTYNDEQVELFDILARVSGDSVE